MNFNTISGGKYSFIDEPELRNIIRQAGRKNIIFVEGYDDEVIYKILDEDYLDEDYLDELYFIDTGFTVEKAISGSETTKTGNCEMVKKYLSDFVQHLPEEKRFYGVIDRDLKTDQEVKDEKNKACYDGRLFIFFERYTLENYFIEPDILCDFLTGKSASNKKLISILDKEKLKEEIIDPILICLASIAAANLTIRHFDSSKEFLNYNVPCKDIKSITVQILNKPQEHDDILLKFSNFKKQLIQNNETQKFASTKTYFSYQFNIKLQEKTRVNIQLNNHKSELARILKNKGLPREFHDLLNLIKS